MEATKTLKHQIAPNQNNESIDLNAQLTIRFKKLDNNSCSIFLGDLVSWGLGGISGITCLTRLKNNAFNLKTTIRINK